MVRKTATAQARAAAHNSGDDADVAAADAANAPPEQVLGRVELEIAELMRRADRTATRPRADGTAGTGFLDRAAYLLLYHLSVQGAENVNALADELGIDASTVTRQVTSLAAAGHVRRSKDPLDGRAVLVEPTQAGLDALAANRAERADLYGRALADWSRLDRALLAELLSRLNASLTDYRRSATAERAQMDA
jgi:DNA-binding MarR family transcriptional regulator